MITTVDPIELNYMEFMVNSMLEDLQNVQLCREYYEGEQTVFLTDRMQEFLQLHNSSVTFRLNICKTIIGALLDELVLKGFSTDEAGEKKTQSEWLTSVYKSNKIDELQDTVHEAVLRDRESFVIVDWDKQKKMPYLVHNNLYVGTDAGGDGYGCWMVYSEERPDEPTAAIKEWVETVMLEGKSQRTRRRRTVYYADRIERFYYDGGWKEYTEDGERFPIPLKTTAGEPLGIPVIHYKNNGYLSEIWDVISNQDAINKLAVDVLGTADMAGFPTLFVAGFDPQDAEGNPIKLSPMQMWGTTKDAGLVKAEKIEATDITPLVNTLMTWIAITANLSSTPVSRFIMTGQIAGSDTLKEQDKPLQKKAERRRTTFGNSWERVMVMARRMANLYGAAGMDETVTISADWKLEYSTEQLKNLLSFGVPQEFIWLKAGMSQTEIEAIKETQEYKIGLGSKIWTAVNQGNGEPVPAEIILQTLGFSPEQLMAYSKARIDALDAANSDEIPTDPITGKAMNQ